MLTEKEVLDIIQNGESDRIEFTQSFDKGDKFSRAICAFANDIAGHKLPGYLLIGVSNDGALCNLKVTEQLLLTLSNLRDSGNIQPLPSMNVRHFSFPEGEVAVVEVFPADMPPVRYKGQVYLRIGPREAIATEQQERELSERRASHIKHFDGRPCRDSSLNDLALDLFKINYLPRAVDPRIIAENGRELKQQLASLRFYDTKYDCPTYAGILLFGKDPLYWLPGAYVQFLRIDGVLLSDPVVNDKRIKGDLLTVLRFVELLIETQLQEYPVFDSILHEKMIADYPLVALREFLMNAIMHRDYESNGPIRFYWFNDHIEIQNPGGLYGQARNNFPENNDYRNPIIAEAMKNLAYVNKYGRGNSLPKEV